MWIFSETGFTSTVMHPTDPELLIVRARDEESLNLVSLTSGQPLSSTPSNDYPFRVFVKRETLSHLLMQQVEMLRYTNYKAHMAHSRSYEFMNSLHGVWAAMRKSSTGSSFL
jgi:hypothetical protein